MNLFNIKLQDEKRNSNIRLENELTLNDLREIRGGDELGTMIEE